MTDKNEYTKEEQALADMLMSIEHRVTDILYEFDEDNPGHNLTDTVDNEIQKWLKPAKAAFCKIIGHQVVSDHCGMPHHDFCEVCEERVPGKAGQIVRAEILTIPESSVEPEEVVAEPEPVRAGKIKVNLVKKPEVKEGERGFLSRIMDTWFKKN